MAQPDPQSLNLLAYLRAPSFIPMADTGSNAQFGSLCVAVNIYKTGLDLSSGSGNFPAFKEKCARTTIRNIKAVSQCSQKQIGVFILPGLSQDFVSSS